MLIYKIKCPHCSAKADAIMTKCGIKGTYREPIHSYIAERIKCQKCGLIRNKSKNEGLDYELWYKTDFKGYSLWAVNEKHLNFLIEWLNGMMNKSELNHFERAYAEILPKCVITNKIKAANKLVKLREKG